MGTKRFAICDKDQEYLRMLQAYLLKRNLADFTVLIFDTVNKALEANKEGPFEILLVGEDIYDTNVAKIDAAKIYILQEDGTKGITEYCTVAKYQSMERMIALRVVNSCEMGADTEGYTGWKAFPSGKEAGRTGIGLRSVSEIAAKYGGSAQFQRKGGEFTARVTLCTPEASGELGGRKNAD